MKDISYYIERAILDVTSLVSKTLGPDGGYILISPPDGRSFVTKDGVTVAKSFRYKAGEEFSEEEAHLLNSIVSIFIEMSRKTDFAVGDGTTSTIVFAGKLFQRLNELKKRGINVRDMLDGVRFAGAMSKQYISKNAYPVKNMEQVEKISYLSANNDDESALLLREIFERIGRGGMITFNKNNAPKDTEVKFAQGFRVPGGYAHRSFVNVPSKKTVEYDNPLILVTDFMFSKANELLQLLSLLDGSKRPLVIVCDKIYGEALAYLSEYNRKGALSVVPIIAPYRGVEKEEFFDDLCLFSGAKFISCKENVAFPVVSMEQLGSTSSVEIGAKYSVFIGTKTKKEILQEHVDLLKKQLVDCADDLVIESIYMRIARFTSNAAEIIVGGNTEAEVLERRYRLEDALKACNNAFVYGFVAGGGLIYLHIKKGLLTKVKDARASEGMEKGFLSFCDTLDCILDQLVANSNISKVKNIRERVWSKLDKDIGFDFKSKQFVPFLDQENLIIEPAGIAQEVIDNSVSIVSLLLNTQGFTF